MQHSGWIFKSQTHQADHMLRRFPMTKMINKTFFFDQVSSPATMDNVSTLSSDATRPQTVLMRAMKITVS